MVVILPLDSLTALAILGQITGSKELGLALEI